MKHPNPVSYADFPKSRLAAVEDAALEWRVIAALLLLFWIAFQVVFYSYTALEQGVGSVSRLADGILSYILMPVELSITAVGLLLSLAIYAILGRARHLSWFMQLLVAVGSALASAILVSVAVSLLCTYHGVDWPPLTARFLAVDSLRWLAPFGLWAGIALSVTHRGEILRRERRMALLEGQAREAQMQALRYQINPHLLYNALNSVASLILDRENDRAEAMVLHLSNFFRASLAQDFHADLPLVEEVALQRLYLEVEMMRFPGLSATFDVPGDLEQVPVPSLILQPLIENAIRHGINPGGLPSRIAVIARNNDRGVEIEVSDSGPGSSDKAGTGIGLANVRDRLLSRYGALSAMDISRPAAGGYCVRLQIPKVAHG